MATKTWSIPSDLIPRSVEHMRPNGQRDHEGLALWFGDENDGVVTITHLIAPYGPGLVTHPLHLSLSMRAMSRITRVAAELDCYWAGQIHSHPSEMLELSDVDKFMGVLVQDYLSIVCPHYAQRDTRLVSQCGAHVYDAGAYRRLSSAETGRRIVIGEHRVHFVPVEVLT
jgi:hypothetical protein